jgi:hypothetical protein
MAFAGGDTRAIYSYERRTVEGFVNDYDCNCMQDDCYRNYM